MTPKLEKRIVLKNQRKILKRVLKKSSYSALAKSLGVSKLSLLRHRFGWKLIDIHTQYNLYMDHGVHFHEFVEVEKKSTVSVALKEAAYVQ